MIDEKSSTGNLGIHELVLLLATTLKFKWNAGNARDSNLDCIQECHEEDGSAALLFYAGWKGGFQLHLHIIS